MKFHIITLPFDPGEERFDLQELETFSSRFQIISAKTSSFSLQGKAYWSIWLSYENYPEQKEAKQSKVPKLQELTLSQDKCLQELKTWRNQRSQIQGFPPYIIASNALLHDIVLTNPDSMGKLLDLHGFGKQKAAKYGQDILAIVKKHIRT